jgi:hypothetical protein
MLHKHRTARCSTAVGRTGTSGPGRDDFERVDNSGEIAWYSIGEVTVAFAGAPGTGRWTYRVLAVNAMGVWAEEVSNNVRELDPSEVT